MGENSPFLSILILLIIFVVLPSALKFLGQYSIGNKGADRRRLPDDTEAPPEEKMQEYQEYLGEAPSQHDFDKGKPQISNKPITPKWF
jgi:hypothetical protein